MSQDGREGGDPKMIYGHYWLESATCAYEPNISQWIEWDHANDVDVVATNCLLSASTECVRQSRDG